MGGGGKFFGWWWLGRIGDLDRCERSARRLPSRQQLPGRLCEIKFCSSVLAIQRFADERSATQRQGTPAKRLFLRAIDFADHIGNYFGSSHRGVDGSGGDIWRT